MVSSRRTERKRAKNPRKRKRLLSDRKKKNAPELRRRRSESKTRMPGAEQHLRPRVGRYGYYENVEGEKPFAMARLQ